MQTQIKSQISPQTSKRFVIVLLEEFAIYSFGSLLDALNIANVLSGKALYNWIVLTESGAVIRSSAHTEFKADFGLIELKRDDTVLICGGLNVQQSTTKNLVSWIKKQARKGVSIGGVDTGSYAVA
jgi:transcriptional regulator GlxA family with amidase domain